MGGDCKIDVGVGAVCFGGGDEGHAKQPWVLIEP